MDASEHDFLDAIRMQCIDFVADITDAATAFGTTGDRHDTKSAAISAAILYLDKGAVSVTRKKCGFGWQGGTRWHGGTDKCLASACYQGILLGIGHNQIHAQF